MSTTTSDNLSSLPTPKNGWLIIYAVLACIALAGLIISIKYRVMPKKTEVIAKRKIPATNSAYTLMLSPLDSLETLRIGQAIRADIGVDSAVTKMVVGGTALYKQCTSSAEYEKLIAQGLREAQPDNLEKQALMFSQFVGIMVTDTIPVELYLAGKLGGTTFEAVDKRMSATCKDLDLRSSTFGRVRVVSYLRPIDNSINRQFMKYFRDRGFEVIER
ncbi:MAG: hypothetical protein IPM69_10935 [Ignavibacteria bacterium]|nr:hypothetical protein [Ignavibacteria bacterium]